MNLTDCQYHFKMIMIDDDFVGKSCMLKRYTEGQYPESIGVTIGTSVCNHILEVEPGVHSTLRDVAMGTIYQNTFAYLRVAGGPWKAPAQADKTWEPGAILMRAICCSIPQSAGYLLVFDLGNYKTFTYIKHRHMEVCNVVQPHTVLFMLLGHKCDRKGREVNQDEVEKLASELGAPYIEASAKTGHNVAEAFELLTRRIYQGYLSGEVRLHESWGKIHKNKSAENNKCCASKST